MQSKVKAAASRDPETVFTSRKSSTAGSRRDSGENAWTPLLTQRHGLPGTGTQNLKGAGLSKGRFGGNKIL